MREISGRRAASWDEFPRATEVAFAGLGSCSPARAWPDLQERLAVPWRPRDQVQDLHWQRLRALLLYCWTEVPFYRDLWQGAGADPTRFQAPEDIQALPTVGREELTRGRLAGSFPRATARGTQALVTSGTTSGRPFEVSIGFREYQMKYANHLRQMYLSGWRLGRRSSALHYSGHGQFRGRYSGRKDHSEAWPGLRDVALAVAHRKQVLAPFHRRDTGQDEALVASWYEALAGYRPLLLDTFYVNLLLILDHARRTARPRLSIPIVFVLHTLSEGERARLGQAFDADVFNRYSPHECEGIAFDCGAHSGLHVALDGYRVEITDADGRPAAPGVTGRVVVTDLENCTMPLVRYRIGDLGHWLDESCGCGSPFPLMAGLDGREVDALEGAPLGSATPSAFERFLQGDARIALYQVRHQPGAIDVAVVPAAAGFPDAAWTAACAQHMRSVVAGPSTVRVRAVAELPFEPNGKFRFVGRATA